jgi:hypothetical protein
MTAPITTAFVGDDVALAVDVAGAQPGETCKFDIFDDQHSLLETVFGDITGGTARASWVVDLKGRQPPVSVVFTASVLGQTADAGALQVVPADTVSTAAWIVDPGATAGPQADAVIEDADAADPDFAAGAHFDLGARARPGDRLTLRVEVGDDEGYAIAAPFDILFERSSLDASGALSQAVDESLPFHLVPTKAARAVRLHWTVPQSLATGQFAFRVKITTPGAT